MEQLTPYTPEASREEKLATAVQQLEAGYDQITTSKDFAAYLETASRFHSYSENNIMMIHAQNPDATQVAGFNTWKKLGRWVNKGETGIRIFAPLIQTVRDQDELGNETTAHLIRGFRLVSVFDVGQTAGKDLPDRPMPQELVESSERGGWLFGQVTTFVQAQGATVELADIRATSDTVYGYFRPRDNHIAVEQTLAGDQQAKTLVHEAALFLTVNKEVPFHEREFGETVAEGTAFVVLNHFGIDTGDYSFPYIAAWSENRAMLKAATNVIINTSDAIISGIEDPESAGRTAAPDHGAKTTRASA